MRTMLLMLCGLGIGTGLCLAYSARHPAQLTPARHRTPLPARRLLLSALCAVIAYTATSWVAAIPITFAACWFLPGMLGKDIRHERELALLDAITTFTEMLRDTLSAASGLNQALTTACRHAPAALQPAAAELAERIETREGTTREALHAFADQVDDPTADLVALALAAASEHPTRDLAGALSSLAATAREQAAMRSRTAVAQARTRTAIRMITGTTVALAILLLVIDRAYLASYDTAAGQAILLLVAGLFALALRWLKALAVAPRPGRLWTGSEVRS